ncbi:MAG: GNAT family N-acetyltransferase [Candidatus Hodarchaeales archaeon]
MEIVKKIPDDDMDHFMSIIINAYPGIFDENFKQVNRDKLRERYVKIQNENPSDDFYGLYRESQLLGGMRVHDYSMNFNSNLINVGGVGLVAVDLLHKKERICKALIAFFLDYLRQMGTTVAILYPFRAHFYKQMGFGYGTKMNLYRFKPDSLPRGKSKDHIHYLQKEDKQALFKCYNNFVKKTHGMIEKSLPEIDQYFSNTNVKVVGYKENEEIKGYLVFRFQKAKKDNFIFNNILILEFIYNDIYALFELLTFLHTQADQINRIVFATQDTTFHFLLSDARNESNNMFQTSQEVNTQGRGLMYRIINTKKFFQDLKNHDFGHQTCRLKLNIEDTFISENNGSLILHFENGKASIVEQEDYDVEIKIDIPNFSSMVMGVIGFRKLYQYGFVEISDISFVDTMNKLFLIEEKPVCTTQF